MANIQTSADHSRTTAGLITVMARDGEILVPIDAQEMTSLIRTGRQVRARFGTGGTALVASQSGWALPLLAQWRGTAFNEGAGI